MLIKATDIRQGYKLKINNQTFIVLRCSIKNDKVNVYFLRSFIKYNIDDYVNFVGADITY